MLSPETKVVLSQYLEGEISNNEMADWLAGAEYDDTLGSGERDLLARVRLTVIEVQEGTRDAQEIINTVAKLLASAGQEKVVFTYRSGSSTTRQGQPALSSTPTQVQRVGISP